MAGATRFTRNTCLCLLVLLVGCQNPLHAALGANRVAFEPLGLMDVNGGLALVYGIANKSSEPLWAIVDFDDPNGDRQCGFVKKIDPGESPQFHCPLTTVLTEREYRLRLAVFADDRLSDFVAGSEPAFRVSESDIAAFERLRGRITVALPRGVVGPADDAAASPALPAVFEPTWFRRLHRTSTLVYEDSGRLTVDRDAALFAADETTIRIPFAEIVSVRLERMSNDTTNWVVVSFTTDDQKLETVGFKDGEWISANTDTGMIFLTLRRATRK